jgi:hypothetical protein
MSTRAGLSALALALALAPVSLASAAPLQAKQDKQAEQPKDKQTAPKAGDGTATATKSQSEIDAEMRERLKQIGTKKPAAWTPEELAEAVILSYGGRHPLSQLSHVYTSGKEEGRITIVTAQGEFQGDLTRRYVNGPKMGQDRVRMDLILETAPKPENHLRYTITYNGATVWAAQNNSYITPDAATAAAFKAAVLNDYTALFRYREEGATLSRGGSKKVAGLDTEILDLTRPDGSKMRFYISTKTYRILHLDYEVPGAAGQPPTLYRESYSEWISIQQALLPGRRKLRSNDQLVQTIDIKTATYGGTFDDSVFLQL